MKYYILLALCVGMFCSKTFAQNNNTTIIINGNVVNSDIGVNNNNNSNSNNNNRRYNESRSTSTSTSAKTGETYWINDEFFEQLPKLASLTGKKRSYFSFDSNGSVKFINNNLKKYGRYSAVKTDRNIIVSIFWENSSQREDLIMNRWSKIFTYQSKEYKATSSVL